MHFLLVQFEFTHAVGPPAGRYVVERDGAAVAATGRRAVTGERRGPSEADVLVIGITDAPVARSKMFRRARRAKDPGDAVPLTLVTFVKGTEPLERKADADAQLEAIRRSEDRQKTLVSEGLEALNRAIRGYRAGSRDPYVIEITRDDPRLVRIGYGETDGLRDGIWKDAIELAPPVARPVRGRVARLRPAETAARVLTGEFDVLETEDLLIRASLDLDQGRARSAAHQVRAAVLMLDAELDAPWRARPAQPVPTHEGQVVRADALVAAALSGPLSEADLATLEELIADVERAIEAWRYPHPDAVTGETLQRAVDEHTASAP